MFSWILCFILTLVCILLAAKMISMRKALREIAEEFVECLSTDTNALITISSRDKRICQLASSINHSLRLLHAQRRRYMLGDHELKEAVTNISHDLRTPLTAIDGYLELLGREKISPAATRYLSYIKNRTNALRQLTEELFRYTVILSAEQLTLTPVDVKMILEESLLSFYGAMAEKGITPNVIMTDEAVIRMLNSRALSRIFNNILDNILKYSDGDCTVELRGDGTISFHNHARLLNEVQAGKLFNRFFTVETARHSTGLGLSIAKTLVEQMHGSISAAYQTGQLSITITFPEPPSGNDI